MDDTNTLIEQRKASLAKLREKGIDPFQNKFTPGVGCGEARAKYVAGEWKEGQHVEIAGRITAHRDMGKSQFMDLKDQSGRIQIYAQKQTLGDEQFDLFKHLDLADFIGVKGELFTTKAGEPSVKITSFTILAKALRPPPAKWHGLEDTETRYRQRYLDLMANDEVKDIFLKRSAIVREIRNFFHGRGYVEVETPMMQSIPGGAAAQPFKTYHNALGCDFYLRIAIELYHKRLLVGGIDKLFEIGKNFRNEGLSRRHNPEFTMLEAYQAFGDYESMMETVESLICHVAKEVLGTLNVERSQQRSQMTLVGVLALRALGSSFVDTLTGLPELAALKQSKQEMFEVLGSLEEKDSYDVAAKVSAILARTKQLLDSAFNAWDKAKKGKFYHTVRIVRSDLTRLELMLRPLLPRFIDLTPPWRRVRYKDLVREEVKQRTGYDDWFSLSPEDRRRIASGTLELAGDIADGYEDFEVTGAVFEKLVEPTLIQPTFVTHLPKELVPLAKLSPDDPTTVEVFECCINGQEIAPGYTEQNDPIAQRNTLEHQAGGEQQKLDEDFLVALEHGMPPAGGIGIGIDRLCMMLLGQESIRDVILFPQMRPK